MQVQNHEACLQACNECAAACLKGADPKAMGKRGLKAPLTPARV